MKNSVLIQNLEKNDKINNNIFERNFSSSQLTMNFSPRAVNTKYTYLPILDNKSTPKVNIDNHGIYDSESTFFPGDRNPHYCGFAINVDKESTLRNQFFALQKADQAKWFPESNSDLYENNINFTTVNKNLEKLSMFKNEIFNNFNPNISDSIGNNLFYNATRVQLKNLN